MVTGMQLCFPPFVEPLVAAGAPAPPCPPAPPPLPLPLSPPPPAFPPEPLDCEPELATVESDPVEALPGPPAPVVAPLEPVLVVELHDATLHSSAQTAQAVQLAS